MMPPGFDIIPKFKVQTQRLETDDETRLATTIQNLTAKRKKLHAFDFPRIFYTTFYINFL